jgi:murein DD-endopeptidase MepM/ murein hydrolase activator NlpD
MDGSRIKVRMTMESSPKELLFYPNQRFSKAELAYFLKIFFLFPVQNGRITSGFGRRINPFSSIASFHTGIDIAAPTGTEVTASREGVVTDIGFDFIFGNYVLISHSGNYQTMYAHLKTISVQLNQRINSGMIIGAIGSSGLSTGPHLHFEIRWNGKAIDPLPLLPKDYK